jgi:YidC/Oxa1 family membrane protein insertase
MKPIDPKEEDRIRMIVAVIASLLILFGFHHFVDKPRLDAVKAEQQRLAAAAPKKAEVTAIETAPLDRKDALQKSARVKISGEKLAGSLSLKGARLDDLLLLQHYTTIERKENVALLSPKATPGAYYVENGMLSSDSSLLLPGADTVWRVKSGSAREIVAGGEAVTLIWDNGQGLVFEQDIALDTDYLFTFTQRVFNNSGKDVTLNAFHLAARQGLPHDFTGMFVQHEGPVAMLNGEGHEPSYKDLNKGEVIEEQKAKGWLGISDKYWLVALLPDAKEDFGARIVAASGKTVPTYQVDAVMPNLLVPNGGKAEDVLRVYAGVKDVKVMKQYESAFGFDNLQYGIDFGMWYFLTKPFFSLLHLLASLTGSIAIAILLMTVVVRSAVFPLASKSFRSMAKMKIIAPHMKELQEKHKDDKNKLQMEIFELYKRENVNPFSGCWPMLIQIPIFFALYKVILISVELRHAPFWGWIHDLSAPDPTSLFNLFGLLPFTPPQVLMIGGWPILFCLSMILQKRISPPMPDATQEALQTWFPYIVTVMMAHFSVGLVIYWTWSNVLGTLQQYYILKKVGGEETSLIRGHAQRRKQKTAGDGKK